MPDWRVQKFIGRNTCERNGMETGLGRIHVRPQCRCDKSLAAQQELWSKDHLQAGSCKCPGPFTALCAYKLGAATGKDEPSHPTLLSHWLETALKRGDLDLNADLNLKETNCSESFLKGTFEPYISVSVINGSYPEPIFWRGKQTHEHMISIQYGMHNAQGQLSIAT